MEAVAAALGMVRRGRRWSPCPRCGQAADRDGRPTVLLSSRGWYCVVCKSGGPDGVNLASWSLAQRPKPTREVLAFLSDRSLSAAAVDLQPEPPSRINPSKAISMAKSIRQVQDPRLLAWLERRQISATAPAGWLPRFWAPWWKSSRRWPLVIPACTGTGVVESIHGIAVDSDVEHKTCWPSGASSRELLFAAPRVRAWLSGSAPPPSDVVVVEGATDFLTATVQLPECAVIGITSGSATALRLVPRSSGQRWYVATDPDEAGEKYKRQVAQALFPSPVYPFNLRG